MVKCQGFLNKREKATSKIMTQNPGKQDKVLAVVNRKGGVAKTTTAINLAHGLSRKLMRRVAPKDLNHISDPGNLYQ